MGTTTTARLILASKNIITGKILYTFLFTFPRPILAEVNTHGMGSKNTSSSRAIPMKKMRQRVVDDPFIPMSLGQNQKGMQAGEEITGWRRKVVLAVIRAYRYCAVSHSWLLETLGVHKQISNRYLEPWSWCDQCFSITEIDNLLLLRNHPDAEPHFHELARQVASIVKNVEDAFDNNYVFDFTNNVFLNVLPIQQLAPGDWHLPWLTSGEQGLTLEDKIAISTARCGRTSYRLLDEDKLSSVEKDKQFCNALFGAYPMHLSPTEHPAQAMEEDTFHNGKFRSFKHYRKFIVGESGTKEAQHDLAVYKHRF